MGFEAMNGEFVRNAEYFPLLIDSMTADDLREMVQGSRSGGITPVGGQHNLQACPQEMKVSYIQCGGTRVHFI